MNNNEIKINVPEGMEIDKENSTFECIKFKPKWIPKRGDICVAGTGSHQQIMVVERFVFEEPSISGIGFVIKPVIVLSNGCHLTLYKKEISTPPSLWIEKEASKEEKKLLFRILNEQGYVYDPSDSRIVYKKEKKKLPETWKEFCIDNPIEYNECYINAFSCIKEAKDPAENRNRQIYDDANTLPSREYAEAMLTLCKLIQLRDCYNDGWEPDWNSFEEKYVILFYCNKIVLSCSQRSHCLLAFKTQELRNTFYKNFSDLIEQAKLLL